MPNERNSYLLSNKADEDISSIADYTIEKFGLNQAKIYRDGLISTFHFLASNPNFGRKFIIDDTTHLKRYNYESHVIFFQDTISGIIILRVLGSKMDYKRHL